MARTSSVLPVKRYLLGLLTDSDIAAAGAIVRMGLPAEEPTQRVRCYVLTNLPREYAAVTEQGRPTAEVYTVPVFLEGRVIGNDLEAVEEQLEGFVGVVFDLIDEDPEFDGACTYAEVGRVIGPVTQPTTDGWISQTTVEIDVQSWV